MKFTINLTKDEYCMPVTVDALSLFISTVLKVRKTYLHNVSALCIIFVCILLCNVYLKLNISLLAYFIIGILLIINIFELLKLKVFVSIFKTQHIIYTKIYMDQVTSFLNNYYRYNYRNCAPLKDYIKLNYNTSSIN